MVWLKLVTTMKTKNWISYEDEASSARVDSPSLFFKIFEEKIVLNISTGLLLMSMLVMFYEAAGRSVFSISHWWAEELVRFLIVWSVLLSFGVASRKGNFIRMELLYDKFPHGIRVFLNFINCIGGLIFCAVLMIAGYEQVAHLEKIGMRTDSNLDLELWVVRSILPICGLLYSIYFIRSGFSLLKGKIPSEEQ